MRGCRRHQPPDLTCSTCAGRYARRSARAILAAHPRQLHAVKFSTHLSTTEFRSWRIAARNIVDHQRRGSRWWRGVSLYVWLDADGRVSGIVALDAITPEEFEEAFRRWEPMLRRLGPEEVADEVYGALRPGVIAETAGSGYQSVRLSIRATVRARRPASPRMRTAPEILPMAVLL
jgi:hypothetical protein